MLIHPTSVDFSIAQYIIFVMYIFICIMDMHVLIRITHTLCISYIILLCVYGCVLVFFSIAVFKSLDKQQLTGEKVYFGL